MSVRENTDWHVCLTILNADTRCMSKRENCRRARITGTENASAGRYVCLSEKITDWHACPTMLNADTRRMSERGNYRLARMSEREKIATAGWYVCMCRKIAGWHVCLKEKK